MRLGAKVIDRTGFDKHLVRLPDEARKQIADAVAKGALIVQGEARRTVQRGPRSGRVYQKYKPRRRHQASAPGEPAKTDTGRLVASIFVDIDPNGLGASIGTDLLHGLYTELGTEEMEPRPWLFPSFERSKRQVVRLIRDAVRKANQRSGRG